MTRITAIPNGRGHYEERINYNSYEYKCYSNIQIFLTKLPFSIPANSQLFCSLSANRKDIFTH